MAQITKHLMALTISVTVQAEVPGEKDLIKITNQKIPMERWIAELCTGPGKVVGPHDTPTIHLYVNKAVIDYRKKEPDAVRYPIGSVFYKEKYDHTEKATLSTIMTKIADNNRVDDWRYEMIELPSGKPVKIDAATCRDCHERYEHQGFISKVTVKALAEYLNRPAVAPPLSEKPKGE